MPQSPVPLGEVFAGKYRVDRVLGEGGMGIVVAAHHLELDQPVAIKFLLDDVAGHAEGAERFRREARAAAKIYSDHVVRVLDVGVLDSGVRFMVMEYMDGHDLSDEIAEKGSLPVGVAASYILQVIDAVGHAHAVGIVHRDLKPANLFLATRADGSKRIKVLDFGISKTIGRATASELSLTKTSAWIGSPLYMAPEQMQSARDVDHRADIWSLGAILYELISGQTPYQAESLPQLCNMLITQDPVPIQTLCPSIPDGLAAAVMGCLVRDRDQRIQSTAELGQVLANYATTNTGTGMRSSLLDQTEVHAGAAPALSARGPGSTGALSEKTNAAWGGTDSQEKPRAKVGLFVAALAVFSLLGLYFITRSSGEGSEGTAEPASAEPASAEPTSAQPESAQVTQEVPSVPEVEPGHPSPSPQSPPVPPEKQASQVETEKAVASPAPGPRPQAKPRPSPVPPPTPAPAGTPPKDDFADFGGRR